MHIYLPLPTSKARLLSTAIFYYFGFRQSSYKLTITDVERALSWTLNKSLYQLLNIIKWMNTLAILRGTFGNFRPLLFYYFDVRQSSYKLTITDIESALSWSLNENLYQLVNTIKLMKTLAILRGTFGKFRPLSFTTSACVKLHINLPLPTSNARYREHLIKSFTNLWTLWN